MDSTTLQHFATLGREMARVAEESGVAPQIKVYTTTHMMMNWNPQQQVLVNVPTKGRGCGYN